MSGSYVYYASQGVSISDGTLTRVPIVGGNTTVLATGLRAPDGAVRRVPITGGALVDLASMQEHPEGLAVDGTSAYFSTTSGAVMKVAK